MFFYKKTGTNNWEIVLDENKQKYRDIYTNKLTRNIRNYYKNILETKFNEINNEHIATLEKLGLNIPDEEINEDIELSAQLEEELNQLNDTKYKLFQTTQLDMENILKYIQTISNKNDFFEFIINKYVVAEHKFPIDFSSEYEKTKTEFNKNLKDLLDDFSNMEQLSNITNVKEEREKPAPDETVVAVADAPVADAPVESSSGMESLATGAMGAMGEIAKNIPTDLLAKGAIEAMGAKDANGAMGVMAKGAIEAMGAKDANGAMGALGELALGAVAKNISTDTLPNGANDTNGIMGELGKLAVGAVGKMAKDALDKKKGGNIYGGESGNSDNSQDLENFISKISQNLSNESNPNNINVAISKLQLMYAFQNKDYKTLINKYSKLTDSYNKLIKLEKINKILITSKLAILTMIDKLFINNLANTNNKDEKEETEEEDDLNNYSNIYNLDDENSVNYKQKKKSKKIIKNIEYKLFDGLNLKNNSSSDNTSVVFGTSNGELIN